MSVFPTGVALMTSGRGEQTEVLTVNSLVSVSLSPLLVLVSLRRGTRILRTVFDQDRTFAINFLAAEQEQLARLFAASGRPRGLAAVGYLDVTWTTAGSMLVSGAIAALECRLDTTYGGGDHELLLGRVTGIHSGQSDVAPLVFHRGSYTAIDANPMLTATPVTD